MNEVHKKVRGRPPKADERRLADRQALVAAAVAVLVSEGPAAFSARQVAKRAGTAVGSVYAQFSSLEALRLEVNAVTMRSLRDALIDALAAHGDASVEDRLLCLADAYLSFAASHHAVWASLFERRSLEAPPAIMADIAALFAVLEQVLREAGMPDGDDLRTIARALWASVHGMVFLGEIGGLGPVRDTEIRPMIRALVTATVRGLFAPVKSG